MGILFLGAAAGFIAGIFYTQQALLADLLPTEIKLAILIGVAGIALSALAVIMVAMSIAAFYKAISEKETPSNILLSR